MGACCSVADNRGKGIIYKKPTNSLQILNSPIEQNNLISQNKPNFPITLDQVNRSIDEWKELTKRRKFNHEEKLSEQKNLFIDVEKEEVIDVEVGKKDKMIFGNIISNYEILEMDKSNNEINQDFLNINKKLQKGFSDISSTIHFTFLNSKDFAYSKLNNNKFHYQNNLQNSVSIVTVLDELNNVNYKNDGVNMNSAKKKNEKSKILIQNNAFSSLIKNDMKELSISVLEKSKMTIKKKENNLTNSLNNNVQVNSYVIVNRTHENQFNTIEEDSSRNNDYATFITDSLHSIPTNEEFNQEKVFINIEKIDINDNNYFFNLNKVNKIQKDKNLKKFNILSNGINFPTWSKEIQYKIIEKDINNNFEIYMRENINEMKIEWRKININKATETIKTPQNITQGIANNCSLIAALISVINYDKMLGNNLLNSIITFKNKNNLFYVKLYFNGEKRFMEIDDIMPFNKNNQKSIFSKSSEAWINLIEKAIFFLYNENLSNPNFNVKSNPSYEIYHLTGWIPEVVQFQDITNKSNLWQRLYTNFIEGNIMVNLGTGILPVKEACKIKGSDAVISTSTDLIQEHSYSVIEVIEINELKLMKCKNPWGHTLPSIAYDVKNKKIKNEKQLKEIKKEEENGIFYIDWENVLSYFSYLFLAWNPQIYPCKYSFVSYWKNFKSTSKFFDESFSLENNPQYIITIPEHHEDFEIRILISKYINNLENRNKNKISFKLFWFEGYQIIYPIEHLRTLNPVREANSDVFIFEASTQVEQYVLVIIKNSDKQEELTEYFSLEVFSFIDIDVKEIPKKEYIQSKPFKFIDTWSANKSGGNLYSPNFINNPQFKITLNSKSHLQIKLETLIPTPIMICLIESGNHLSRVSNDLIMNNKNPGFYFNSFSYLECILESGEYNIICVCQDEKLIGKFCIEINLLKNDKLILLQNKQNEMKVEKLSLINLPFVEYLKSEWDKKNNKGIFENNLCAMIRNPGFIFNCPQTTRVKFILKSCCKFKLSNDDCDSITIFLYRIEDDESLKLILDGRNIICSVYGYYSDEVEIEPNSKGYLLICINPNKKLFSKFDLEIQSYNRLVNVYPSTSLYYKKKSFNVYSKWDKSFSGGGLDQITFYKNPSYEIITSKRIESFIELISHNEFLVSMILIEIDINNENKNYMIDLTDNKLISSPKSKKDFKYYQEVFSKKIVLLSDKKYILIPFTKFTNQVKYYINILLVLQF